MDDRINQAGGYHFDQLLQLRVLIAAQATPVTRTGDILGRGMEEEGAADVSTLVVVLASDVQHDDAVMQPRVVCVGSDSQLKSASRCDHRQVGILA